jgi:hypothetical protein
VPSLAEWDSAAVPPVGALAVLNIYKNKT